MLLTVLVIHWKTNVLSSTTSAGGLNVGDEVSLTQTEGSVTCFRVLRNSLVVAPEFGHDSYWINNQN
jgi:hypothetical protein